MNDEIIIRRFEEKDAADVYKVVQLSLDTNILNKVYENTQMQVWKEFYSIDYIKYCNKIKNVYVAVLNDEIVGSAAVNELDNRAYVSLVYVNPNIQGKGIGKKLIEAIENDEISKKLKIVYLEAALSANIFYQKLGYSYPESVPEIILDCGVEFIKLIKVIK